MNPETCAEIAMLVAVVFETLERLVIDERDDGTMDSFAEVNPWSVGSTGSGFASTSASTSRGWTLEVDNNINRHQNLHQHL